MGSGALTISRPYCALGSDKSSDIAVLKIDAHNLPTVHLGNSSQLHVGDYVLAIGAPFGLEETAMAGIVSATERSLPGGSYVPFIQTDAAVNPGNNATGGNPPRRKPGPFRSRSPPLPLSAAAEKLSFISR